MAVKQNNSEENNSGSTVRPDSVIETESTLQQQNKSSGDKSSTSSINTKNQKTMRDDSLQHNNHKLNEPEDEQSFNNNSPTEQKNCRNLQMLIEYFYKIAYDKNIGLSTSAQNIVIVANQLLIELALCPVPIDPQQLKNFKLDIQKVGEIFMKVGEKNQQYFYLSYLEQVMKLITTNIDDDNNKQNLFQYPSCSIAIIFQLFPEESISKAVLFIFSSNDMFNNDQSIMRAVKLLSIWLRQCTFSTHLNIWILAILNHLREQRKYELLIDIIRDIIEPIFIALIIPILRPKVYPIIFQALTSIKDTPIIFHKIIGRAPRVLKQLKRELLANDVEETRKIYQELIDLIAALIEHFPGHNNLYKDMEEFLADCNISHYYRAMLENSIWGSDSLTLLNSTNPRVGLVNLGNTCYMNSVLQALVMTKDFCRELLLADIKSPLILKVQQLFAQLLHSQRPELTPTIVLHATRPPYFLPGFQQDSSEFLGYLLESFHEQETNLLTKPIQNVDQELEKTIDNNDMIDQANIDIKLNLLNYDNENMEIDSEDSNNTSPTTTDKISTTQKLSTPPKITITSSELTKTPSSHQQTSLLTTQINNKTPLTIIDKIFTGKMAITYKCLTCGWKSKNHDAFRDFPLSFPEATNNSQENYTVQELLDYYCSQEILNGDNQYYCEQCKKCCDAERLMNVINAPKNLILTLKQFKYDQNNHMRAKLMHKVFHDEKVTLKVYNNSMNVVCADNNTVTHKDENLTASDNTATEADENVIYYNYELYAAVVHTGFSMDSGHYYTYATDNISNDCNDGGGGSSCNNPGCSTSKNDNSNEWYKFNDNIVTACRITELHKLSPPNTPYILFYRMQSKYIKTIDGMTENKLIENIKIPKLPALEELPSYLRDIVNNDNILFVNETRLRQINNNSTTMNTRNISRRGGGDEDDNQPPPPPPPSNCGGNALDININNYIF